MLIVLGAVYVYPLIRVVVQSFSPPPGGGGGLTLLNYHLLFMDPAFTAAVEHNLVLLLGIPLSLVIALGLAILLFERIRGAALYRFAIFLPFTLPIPVIGIALSYFLEKNGVLNTVLRGVGLRFMALDWLGNPALALPSVLGVITWRNLGFGVLLFYARLITIDKELIEAARSDGATTWQIHLFVTIPQLRNVITFYVVLTFINMISWVFNIIYVMTSGGPGTSTTVSEYYIYQMAFPNNLPSLAAAAACLVLAGTLVVVIVRFMFSKEFLSIA